MAGYQAEKSTDINVLEMTVTGEKDKNHSLLLLISKSVCRCECLLLCFVLQYVSSSGERLLMADNLPSGFIFDTVMEIHLAGFLQACSPRMLSFITDTVIPQNLLSQLQVGFVIYS